MRDYTPPYDGDAEKAMRRSERSQASLQPPRRGPQKPWRFPSLKDKEATADLLARVAARKVWRVHRVRKPPLQP